MAPAPAVEPPTIWRTKLRSTLLTDHEPQVRHCLDNGIVGIGWRIDDVTPQTPIGTVLEWIEKETEPGWGRTAMQVVHRFAVEAQAGDFVWTRDTFGRYLLCRITGDWRYDGSDAAKAVDVHQVRAADWAPPLNDLEVPGAVIRAFVGTSSSFSRIHDVGARELTAYLWEKLHDRPLPQLHLSPRDVLTTHLDPYDVEDLVYVWLQIRRGYVALPRARQRDTPAYEFSMLNRDTGRRGIVQVKTGETRVDLDALAAAVTDDTTDTYAFATCEEYDGDHASVSEIITCAELLEFVEEHPELLPVRVRTWFDLAGSDAAA